MNELCETGPGLGSIPPIKRSRAMITPDAGRHGRNSVFRLILGNMKLNVGRKIVLHCEILLLKLFESKTNEKIH